jgi:hypothetical protein
MFRQSSLQLIQAAVISAGMTPAVAWSASPDWNPVPPPPDARALAPAVESPVLFAARNMHEAEKVLADGELRRLAQKQRAACDAEPGSPMCHEAARLAVNGMLRAFGVAKRLLRGVLEIEDAGRASAQKAKRIEGKLHRVEAELGEKVQRLKNRETWGAVAALIDGSKISGRGSAVRGIYEQTKAVLDRTRARTGVGMSTLAEYQERAEARLLQLEALESEAEIVREINVLAALDTLLGEISSGPDVFPAAEAVPVVDSPSHQEAGREPTSEDIFGE